MSYKYDIYLTEHKANVAKAYYWLKGNLPEVLKENPPEIGMTGNFECDICDMHDASKNYLDEYRAYDDYFYGGNKSYEVVKNFNYAWLQHIHRNPHHWQYWVLINDNPEEGTVALDMPRRYIIEMICDWWAFSWKDGELTEIFDWYKMHKKHMILSDDTRKTVEDILDKIKKKLEEENTEETQA